MKANASAGFTLLEIVVALAVFGFLLVGLSQSVRFGLTAWQQDARLSGSKTDFEAVDRSLRSIIENFAPSEEPAQPAIQGSIDTVTGVTRLRVPGSGLTPVRVEAGVAISGNRLVLRWRPYHHWTAFGAPPPPQETDLMAGVARLRIEYWQPTGRWASTWQEPGLPLLIRLRVTPAGDNPPHWPDIVAAPLLSAP
jgi:general secretion pathway protein J